jgi:hypothetical protein
MYHGLLYKKPGYDLAPHKDAVSNTPEQPNAGWLHWAGNLTSPRVFKGSCLTDPDQDLDSPRDPN